MALHRGDGHAQRFGNLFRRQVFLIPQRDHRARRFRKRSHQLPDLAAQQRIARRGIDRQLGQLSRIRNNLRPPLPLADPVNGAVYGGAAQPVQDVIVRLQLVELRVQLQKHILCGLFGEEAVAQNAKGDAEDHRLVLQHDGSDGLLASFQVYILPSNVYTPARARQDAEFWGS